MTSLSRPLKKHKQRGAGDEYDDSEHDDFENTEEMLAPDEVVALVNKLTRRLVLQLVYGKGPRWAVPQCKNKKHRGTRSGIIAVCMIHRVRTMCDSKRCCNHHFWQDLIFEYTVSLSNIWYVSICGRIVMFLLSVVFIANAAWLALWSKECDWLQLVIWRWRGMPAACSRRRSTWTRESRHQQSVWSRRKQGVNIIGGYFSTGWRSMRNVSSICWRVGGMCKNAQVHTYLKIWIMTLGSRDFENERCWKRRQAARMKKWWNQERGPVGTVKCCWDCVSLKFPYVQCMSPWVPASR